MDSAGPSGVSPAAPSPATAGESLDALLACWIAGPSPADPRTERPLRPLRRELQRVRRTPARRRAVLRSASTLCRLDPPLAEDSGLERLPLAPPLHRKLWNYALADHLALRFQEAERVACRRLLGGILATGLALWSLKNGSQLWPDAPPAFLGASWFTVGGVVLLAASGAVSFGLRARFQRIRMNFLLSRTLAEALRVDLFQRAAGTGVDTRALLKEQHLLPEAARSRTATPRPHFAELALEKAEACAGTAPIPPQTEGIALARKYWLEDQRDYFLGSPGKDGASASAFRKHRAWRSRSRRAVVAAVGFLVVSLSAQAWAFLQGIPGQPDPLWVRLTGAVAEYGVAVSGLFAGYFHQLAALQSVKAQKFRRAGLHLSALLEEWNQTPDSVSRTLALLRDAARAAVEETADWGVHQREHTPEASFR